MGNPKRVCLGCSMQIVQLGGKDTNTSTTLLETYTELQIGSKNM